MNKAKINYLIDIPLAISFFINAGTGILKMYGWFGTKTKDYLLLHDWTGIIFITLGIIHLATHWNWIKCMTKNFYKKNECKRKS